MLQARQATGEPPYFPTGIASVGGKPTVTHDIPVCAVLILIYLLGAISNMTIFQLNRRKGHKFPISWAMFGFCMARVATNILRIVWATRPTNARIVIAAMIFMNLGILVIYIVLFLLSLRIFRATHPSLGWSKPLRIAVRISYALLFVAIILTIAFTILSFYTLNPTLRNAALWIQRASILYMLFFNIISLSLSLLSMLLPREPDSENFDTGNINSKLLILGIAFLFIMFISGFRTGTSWAPPRLASNPGWYDTKAAFYVIEFGFEIVIVYWFLFMRFDRRFWVPNGSHKPGDYLNGNLEGRNVGKTSNSGTPEQEKA